LLTNADFRSLDETKDFAHVVATHVSVGIKDRRRIRESTVWAGRAPTIACRSLASTVRLRNVEGVSPNRFWGKSTNKKVVGCLILNIDINLTCVHCEGVNVIVHCCTRQCVATIYVGCENGIENDFSCGFDGSSETAIAFGRECKPITRKRGGGS
jgi:hypothetical protein